MISGLNQMITIEAKVIQSDEIGNRLSFWQEYFKTHAKVDTKQLSEKTGEVMVYDNSMVVFILRWCQKLKYLDSLRFRVVFNDVIYNITVIDQMNFKSRLLKLHCRREER